MQIAILYIQTVQ